MGSISAALILEAVRPAFIDSTPYLQMSRAKVEFVRTRSVTHADFCQHVCCMEKSRGSSFIAPVLVVRGARKRDKNRSKNQLLVHTLKQCLKIQVWGIISKIMNIFFIWYLRILCIWMPTGLPTIRSQKECPHGFGPFSSDTSYPSSLSLPLCEWREIKKMQSILKIKGD